MPLLPEHLESSLLLPGNADTAYRDPAVYYHNGQLYLYFTLVESRNGSDPLEYVAMTTTADLVHFTPVLKLTPGDPAYNYSSPGNILEFNGSYHLCCQTYCRENGEKFGNERSRIFVMHSGDLIHWSEPELLRVKGPDVPEEEMGRMIDAYLLREEDTGLIWCFYKQNGCSFSTSKDLITWTPQGNISCGENVSVQSDRPGHYLLWHSPANGIGCMESSDLKHWKACGELITLGQKNWPWASGRLTAGTVLDLRDQPGGFGWLFFHGSGGTGEEQYFDNYAGIGVAWSRDLRNWEWK